ncbi:hypothetical protein AALA69_07760 [Eggerthellaceae bacterium 24-137]
MTELSAFEHKDFGVVRAGVNEKGEAVFCLDDVARALDMTAEEAADIVGEENMETVDVAPLSESDIDHGGDAL